MKIIYYKLKIATFGLNQIHEAKKVTVGLGAFKNHIRSITGTYTPKYQMLSTEKISEAINYILRNTEIFEHDTSNHITRRVILSIERDNKTWKEEYESIHAF